jgi:hypothetical protein
MLRADSQRDGETAAEGLRHHLIAGVIERVARATTAFVLRGGVLTRAWIAPLPRPTRDLDYVGDFAFDVDDTVRRFRAALSTSVDDGVRLELDRLTARGTWLHTQFPGVHVDLPIGLHEVDQTLGVDIGFRDPLVPPPVRHDGALAARPETMLAWKLHGLVEMDAAWRPKDLADAYLIATRVALDDAMLPAAIASAFESRGLAARDLSRALDPARWSTKSARVRWARTRGLELDDVIAALRARLEVT